MRHRVTGMGQVQHAYMQDQQTVHVEARALPAHDMRIRSTLLVVSLLSGLICYYVPQVKGSLQVWCFSSNIRKGQLQLKCAH